MAPLNRVAFFARAARARPTVGRRVFNQVTRRNYASGGDHAPAGSDLPWAIGAAVGTAGGLYLVWPSSDGGHGDGHGHDDSHGKEEAKEDDEAPAEEPAEDSKGDQEGDKSEEKSDDGKEEQSDDKSGDSQDDQSEEKSEDSEEDEGKKGGDDSGDKRTPYEKYDGKPKGGRENTASKEGPNHTGARHASSPHDNSEKSQKGEGIVETARVKGTIDTNRPQR